MILEGNERGYGAELAQHLLNPRDNDHVTIHSVEGFMADDLLGAFTETEAISQATQCSKYLFSLSLNPPMGETVSVEDFEKAIADVEHKLGLVGQPRAIVFHEKNGRRHAHCVWSRINATQMKAINLPHYKRKLGDVTRQLFLTHEWDMPEGLRDKASRDPLNYTREEAGQAKRLKRDPKAIKAMFRRCWEQSDSRVSFTAALKEEGYVLARGERRGFVAVDHNGKVWSLSRWCGVKPKELRARIGGEDTLPSIDDVLALVGDLVAPKQEAPNLGFAFKHTQLIARQREERTSLLKAQEERRIAEIKARQAKLPRGLKAAFFKISGRYQELLTAFEGEVQALRQLDGQEQQHLINKHLAERRLLDRDARQVGLAEAFKSSLGQDPRQTLALPPDTLPLTRDQLLRNPALILSHISKTKAHFDRVDILRELAKRIDDPFLLKDAADTALKSSELIKIEEGNTLTFTTRDYQAAEDQLERVSQVMNVTDGYGVTKNHVTDAIRSQNDKMKRAFGGELSTEQCAALDHVLNERQLACIVGLAGAGKSTLLATAMDAWRLQGVTVHGAALAGKAADGLESASGIQSRTLASLETSWENGYEPIGKGDILVVDEAGMIGTRQLARIISRINGIGAKLVLVGDPDQLQPIEAGTPFRSLAKTLGAKQLTEIHRQHEDWQKQASRDLANGRIAEAVETYAERGTVSKSNNQDHAIEALVEAYAMDVAASCPNSTRLAFAHRRKDVHALNQAIRAALRQVDEPAPETFLDTETGKRAFAAGERIVFGRNDKNMGVKNGMLGTVEKVSHTAITVTLDGDEPRTLTFNPNNYKAFDHGYAVTIHKSQGATVDQSYILASHTMDRHLAYVAMTRHRNDMRLYISEDDRPRWMNQQYNQEMVRREERQPTGPSMG